MTGATPDSLERLAELAAGDISIETEAWLRRAAADYLAGSADSLDDALGLDRAARTQRALAVRDFWIRKAWDLVEPERTSAASRAAALLAAIYQTARTRREPRTGLEWALQRARLASAGALPSTTRRLRAICECETEVGVDFTRSPADSGS